MYIAIVLMNLGDFLSNYLSTEWGHRLCYKWFMVNRPHYAYGMSKAVALAKRLGIPGFTAVEFGVAGGSGLVALEQHALHYSQTSGLQIDVVGFDSGTGMPKPLDYRDIDFTWAAGQFEMDEEALRRALTSANLVLGNVAETAPTYQPRLPIGFVSFDLDYYSSTIEALKLFEGSQWDKWLPRVHAYFDDVSTIEWIGERLAITEWSSSQVDRKIGHNPETRDSIPGFPRWAQRIFEMHFFDHPKYRIRVSDPNFQQLPLGKMNKLV
jgi:hypothetical protein